MNSKALKALKELEEKLLKMTPEELKEMLDKRPLGDVGQFVLDMAELEKGILRESKEESD